MSKKTLFSIVTTAFVLMGAFIAFSIHPMCGEGYDPLRQITHQIARPDIYIVLDVSGSMAWDVNGHSVGVDSTGTVPTGRWSHRSRYCRYGKCKYWYYKLTVSQTYPSRMATVKNALGNSVSIRTPWEAPAEWSASGYPYITNTNWNGGTITGPTVSNSSSSHSYTWKIKYHSKKSNPGIPFTAYDGSGHMTVGSGGVSQGPVDLIGTTSDEVNWGLIVYSTSYGGCTSQTLRVAVDSNDTGDVSAVESWLRLYRDGGQRATGGTPTRGGLTEGKNRLETAFTNDPKRGCGRTFGVILVTDGESNSCNDPYGSWSSCPSSYTNYPAGISEDIWNLKVGSDNVYGRTWVIGVSNAVGRCELNFTAYMGRTDANSPNGDAGFDTANDPYLPASTGDTSNYDTTHGDYAYFATSSIALHDAFASIVASVGAGDYTTSAPTASSSTSTGTISLLATAEYPSWKGHLYAYDITQDPAPLLWDAGEVLSTPSAPGYVAPAARKIYTWDASNNLVEVTASKLSALKAAATAYTPSFDSSKLTTSVIDFIRGNDGSGTGRSWRLGSMINTSPAIIRGPQEFTQGNLPSHADFESTYADRTPVCWVGSDDGMFHAFRLDNGSEVMAILPPNMLAKEVDLYNNYVADPTKNPVGEPQFTADHIYGTASSPRYLDMYFGSPKKYHTVMILTEGPGGTLMAGLDVTSIVPGDTNYALPEVLWTKTHNSLSDLYDTWSVPAVGCTAASGGSSATFGAVAGSGFNENSTSTSQVVPHAFTFDPTNGSSTDTLSLGSDTSQSYVGNQAFAHSVYLRKEAKAYYPDSIVNLGVQADLKGIIWFLSSPSATPTVGIDATTFANKQVQPVYYPPAVGGYYVGTTGYDLFAFGSGTFYEQSTNITGPNVGTSGHFIPSLYLVAKGQDYNEATTSQITRIKIKDLYVPDSKGNPTTTHLGSRSQLTAPPALFIPISSSSANPVALFLIYDPDSELCGGTSYVLKLTFDIQGGKPHVKSTNMYSAGEGAASGFAVVAGKVVVAKSSIGSGGRATVKPVKGVNPTEGMSSIAPLWYRQVE